MIFMEVLETKFKERYGTQYIFVCKYCHSKLRAYKSELDTESVLKKDEDYKINYRYFCPVCNKTRRVEESLLTRVQH